jgi:hypothetical protein
MMKNSDDNDIETPVQYMQSIYSRHLGEESDDGDVTRFDPEKNVCG